MARTSENLIELGKWAGILRAAVPQGLEISLDSWGVHMAPGFARWLGRSVDDGAIERDSRDQWVWGVCASMRGGGSGAEELLGSISGSDGALIDQGACDAIEVWTDCELAAVQALWWGWIESGDGVVRARLVRVCERLIEVVQPDNATNRPWGIGAFVWLGVVEENVEALLYAQTLLHNYQATSARNDALCGAILVDNADGLGVLAARSG